MSRDTHYTCDGCGVATDDPRGWANPYFGPADGKATYDLCPFCTARVLAAMRGLPPPEAPTVADLADAKGRAEAAEKREEALEEALTQARVVAADSSYGAEIARKLTLELLTMLGRKARRRNKRRLREIRLAVADAVVARGEPDFLDEIMRERGLTDADLEGTP